MTDDEFEFGDLSHPKHLRLGCAGCSELRTFEAIDSNPAKGIAYYRCDHCDHVVELHLAPQASIHGG